MEFEVLKKSHIKRNIIIGVVAVLIISAVVLRFTHAKYKVTQSISLANGVVNYSAADVNVVSIYVNTDNGYEKRDTIPDSGYIFNEEESYCTVDKEKDTSINITYDTSSKTLAISPMTTKGTKCYLYFDKQKLIKDTLLANYPTQLTRTDFNTTVTSDTTGTIYYADTKDGRTYYFAGNPTDNWVKFANKYWRIIRINEDGTLRLIYQGTSNTATGTGTQTQTSAFNSSYNNNAYVGLKYTTNNVHGTGTNSTILNELNEWYSSNLSSYADKIDGNAGFCGDRTPYTNSSGTTSGGGTGTTTTYYAGYIRLNKNKQPTFECSNSSDLYTTSGSSQGNKALTYPIGLITADEVAYAGGVYGTTNQSYYLYTNSAYWTMSPYFYGSAGGARVFYVRSDGSFGTPRVDSSSGMRPVINLKADTKFSEGNGTSETPLVVS